MPRRTPDSPAETPAEAAPDAPQAETPPAFATDWHQARSNLENPAGGVWTPGDLIPPGSLLADSAAILIDRAIIVRADAPAADAADSPQE